MNEHAAFIEEILDHPHDDGPRMIYADWLVEQGDPRGEFIQLQCLRESLPKDDPQSRKLRTRELELLREHEDTWLGPVRDLAEKWEFRRGFVSAVRLSTQKFLKTAGKLVRLAPIDDLTLRVGGSRVKKLAACPQLGQIRALTLKKLRLEDGGMEILAASPHLSQIRALALQNAGLTDFGMEIVASCPDLSNLDTLDLYSNRIGPRGVQSLADSPFIRRLRSLDLTENWIESAGVSALAQSPIVEHLKTLMLGGTRISTEGVAALGRSRHLVNLRVLNCCGGWRISESITSEGARVIAESPTLDVERLSLESQQIGDEGLIALAESQSMSNLRDASDRHHGSWGRGACQVTFVSPARSVGLGPQQPSNGRRDGAG